MSDPWESGCWTTEKVDRLPGEPQPGSARRKCSVRSIARFPTLPWGARLVSKPIRDIHAVGARWCVGHTGGSGNAYSGHTAYEMVISVGDIFDPRGDGGAFILKLPGKLIPLILKSTPPFKELPHSSLNGHCYRVFRLNLPGPFVAIYRKQKQ
jgi:hypothetical protein